MEHLRQKFLKECSANLDLIVRNIATAKADPPNADALNDLFRGVHSIKGDAGFFGLPSLERFAADLEVVCSLLLSGTLAMSGEVEVKLAQDAQILADLLDAVEAGIEPVSGYEIPASKALQDLTDRK